MSYYDDGDEIREMVSCVVVNAILLIGVWWLVQLFR